MDKRKIILFSTLTVAILFSITAVATATLTTKYYRLCCPKNDVNIFSEVTVTAKSNDWRVDTVTFYWYSPEGKEFQETVNVVQQGDEKVATSTHNVDVLGYWTILAKFKGGDDTWWWCDDVWKLKCCHFNVIPEVP